jgi:hypothetical protein
MTSLSNEFKRKLIAPIENLFKEALCLHLAEHGNKAAIHPLSYEHAQCAVRIAERFARLDTLK